MYTQKQARSQNKDAAAKIQTKIPADDGGGGNADSQLAQFVEVLSRINQQVNSALEESESTREEIRLLCIRQWTEQAEDEWREKAGGTGAESVPPTPPPPQSDSELRKGDPLYLGFLDMETAVSSAIGMIDLMQCRLVDLLQGKAGGNHGYIADGIKLQASDASAFLLSRFYELFDEARQQRGWGTKGGAR
jgi:hypothetical protein